MTRYIKPDRLVVSGRLLLDQVGQPWYRRPLFTILEMPFSAASLFWLVIETVTFILSAAVLVTLLIVIYFGSQ